MTEGFVGIGVHIGTDVFVRNFVAKTCRGLIDDVEKLDAIQDAFIHYQFLRFWQDTRLQYLNNHIFLGNRFTLQQPHVDCKIPDSILKKGTKHHADGWDTAVRPGTTWCSSCPTRMAVLGFNLMILLKMHLFILLLHGL